MGVSRVIVTSADGHCNISVESVLRLRPLSKREMEDSIILEQVTSGVRNGPATVVLNPSPASLASPIATGGMRGRIESDATANNVPTEYHFHHVLGDSTSQDKIYYTLGLPIATASMSSMKTRGSRSGEAPNCHLLVCMGVTGSGKTYTCIGGSSMSKRRASQDGLVPRLIDSLFSQTKHHAGNGVSNFCVNISIAQVTRSRGMDPHACVIHDLLAGGQSGASAEQKQKRNTLAVRNMAAKFERVISSPLRSRSPMRSSSAEFSEVDADNIDLSVESCADATHAREVLQKGLTNSGNASQGLNHHLLITLQPVSNGSKVGDKIAILDMAGLEKGGRKSSTRGKDSVANKNQEASAAVLHCIRTMMHNTSVRSGKGDGIGMADDDVSELSAVSQKKDPFRRQLKSVPFRQHKVTMLLQSLFIGAASTKVTLVLAAYPGHTDYTEKRILLQDMELLCGHALTSSRGNGATGFASHDARSVGTSAITNLVGSNLLGSFSQDEDDTSSNGFHRAAKSFPKPFKAPTTHGSLALSASLDEGEKTYPKPSAFAPSYNKDRSTVHSRSVHSTTSSKYAPDATTRPLQASSLFFSTTAPALNAPEALPRPAQQPVQQAGSLFFPTSAPSKTETNPRPSPRGNVRMPPENPKYVSDFPGVQLPAKKELSDPEMERTRVTTISSSSHVGGRNAAMPPTAGARFPERDHKKTQSILENDTTHTRPVVPVRASRQPLVRSVIENEGMRTEPRSKNSNDHSHPSTDKHSSRSRSRSRSRAREAISAPREKMESNHERSNRWTDRTHSEDAEAANKLKEMEQKMKDLQRLNEEYEQKCSNLTQENETLKNAVKDAMINAQSKWSKFEEEQFQKAREQRIEDQTLVKKHFRSHLERINHHYQIKNQWAMTDKPHFEIAIPFQFQRAEELNMRDKLYEERESTVFRGEENYAPPKNDAVKPTAPVEIQAKKPKRMTYNNQSGALEALKKLTFG